MERPPEAGIRRRGRAIHVKHVFDGSRYVQAEHLPGDVTPEGRWLLAGEYSYETGIPLKPQR